MSEPRGKNSSSPIWEYFEPVDTKSTKCLICDSVYRNSGNTTNLIDHLKRRHREDHAKFLESLKVHNSEDSRFENAEVPLAIHSIKFEDDNQEVLQMALPPGSNVELIQTGDEISVEEQENVNSIEEAQIEDQAIIEGHEEVAEKAPEFQVQDQEHEVQLVKIVPLPHARSEVWAYFGFIADNEGHILDKTKVVCKMCASTFCYSGNTTNFYSHLKSMHSEIQMRTVPAKNARSMKRTYASINDDSVENDYGHETRNNFLSQDSLADDESIPTRSRQDLVYVEDITHAIVDFIVTDCRPLAVVQGKGFQRLLRLLAPGYALPDKQRLAVAVRKRYDEMRKENEQGAIDRLTSINY